MVIKLFPTKKHKTYINCLKPKNSSDHVEITNKIVKTYTTQISHPLWYICNQSLYTFTKMFRYDNFFLRLGNTTKNGVPQRSILETLLFNTYINDLPPRIPNLSEKITFTDDTGVIISSQTLDDFSSVNKHSSASHKFTANKLALNLDKI